MKALNVAQRFNIKVKDAKNADGSIDASRKALKVGKNDKVGHAVLGAFTSATVLGLMQAEHIIGSMYEMLLVPAEKLDVELTDTHIGILTQAQWIAQDVVRAERAAALAAAEAAYAAEVGDGEEEEPESDDDGEWEDTDDNGDE